LVEFREFRRYFAWTHFVEYFFDTLVGSVVLINVVDVVFLFDLLFLRFIFLFNCFTLMLFFFVEVGISFS